MKTLQRHLNALVGILTVMSTIVATNKSNAAAYTVNFVAGLNLFANQLDNNSGNTANQLLPGLPSNSQLLKWNKAGQHFDIYTKVPFGSGWNPNVPNIDVGEAVFLKVFSPVTFTFSTTLSPPFPTPPITRGITPNCQLCLFGSQTFEVGNHAHKYKYYDITGDDPPANGIALYKYKYSPALLPPPPSGPFGPILNSDPINYPQYWAMYVYRQPTGWFPSVPTIIEGEGVWIGEPRPSIEGTAFEDNGTCTTPGLGILPNWKIKITGIATASGASISTTTVTDQNGHYVFYIPPGTYTVSQVPDACWKRTCPPTPFTYPNVTVNICDHLIGYDFGSQPLTVGLKSDLSVLVYATYPFFSGHQRTAPCCGQTMTYHIFYRNGCRINTGVNGNGVLLDFIMPTQVGTCLSATPPVSFPPWSSCLGGTVTWNLGTLAVGAIGHHVLTVTVDPVGGGTCSQTPPGTLLVAQARIYPFFGDKNIANNTFTHKARTSCSFDPNDKEVTPKGCGPDGLINAQPLTYTVHFQNLGSGPAFDVVVRDQLDPALDPSTLEVLGASHNYDFELNGQEMVWTFPGIYLPAASDDEPGSHGFLSYRVSPLPGLAEGTVITNQASVYFDLNEPVQTPTTTNTITTNPVPMASFTATPRQGSAGYTNDFTYTGGTAGAAFLWDFGPEATPPTSTDMSPSGVIFATNGLRNISLQVSLGGCEAEPATYLLGVGQPKLDIALSDDQVCLSWEGDGYSLQETGTLNVPLPWQTIHPPITVLDSTHFVCLGVTNTFRCYRLTDQP